MIDLFEHNQKAYASAVETLAETGKAAIIHPTGTGKSFIGFKLCEDNQTKTVCWLSPSEYIFKTQLENLKAANGGTPKNIRFYTYAKLMLMADAEIAEVVPDYIILDEFHRCGAEMWGQGVQNLLNAYPQTPILGLSATNIRYLDNQRDMADELFDGNIANEMTLGEAIVRGILNPPKYVLSVYSYQKDLEKYAHRIRRAKNKAIQDAGARYLEALRRAMEKADGLDVVFEKHMTDRTGKYIVFCSNKEHMDEMMEHTEWFEKIDKKPRVYSLYTEDPAASKSFQKFKEDKDDTHLRLLYAIDALNEGVHVDDISGVILLRPTISPIIFKQQIGRALSASKKKEPVIFDIVNNIENLYSIGAIEEEMRAAVTYYRYLGESEKIVNERFKVYDEVQECKALFEKLEDTLSASWEYMYLEAKRYYKANGELEVPKRYKTAEGYSLGNWLHTQRKVRSGEQFGRLDEERIAKLDEIGMRWESYRDLAWERYFEEAKRYFEENGNLDIKALYVTKNGVRLGSWISWLRSKRKNSQADSCLSSERIARLDGIGMIWDQPDYAFERNYSAALAYYRLHGDLDVPAQCTFNGVKLGVWMRNLRTSVNGKNRRLRITDEQISRLDQIGMLWEDKPTLLWNKGFSRAKAYYEKYGDLYIPVTYKNEDGYALGKWLYRQREIYRKGELTKERVALLDSIGMDWGYTRTNDWDTCFEYVEKFFKDNGNLNIPPDYKVDGIWLNKWLNEQKQIYLGKRQGKSLTEEQIAKLEVIGMHWGSASQQAWDNQYAKLLQWYEAQGDIDIPKRHTLSNWLNVQRKKYRSGELSPKQIDKLTKLGMVWEFDDGWENGFAHAKGYIEQSEEAYIPSTHVCDDGYKLGSWWKNQQYKFKSGKLDLDRVARLEGLGLSFHQNTKAEKWYAGFEALKQYMQTYGCEPKPREIFHNVDLYEWLRSQRRRYQSGKLSAERISLLKELGVAW